jgi:O-antigen/teichoic acid export membrane protein
VSLNRDRILRLSKEGAWVVSGQIATVFGTLLTVRLLTEYLTPIEYGRLALALTFASFVGQFTAVINQGISRYYSIAKEANKLHEYYPSVANLTYKASFVTFILTLLSSILLYLFGFNEWQKVVYLVGAVSLITGFSGAINSIQSAARNRLVVAFMSIVDAWSKCAFAFLSIIMFGACGESVLFGYILSALLVLMLSFYSFNKINKGASNDFKTTVSSKWQKNIWEFSWPYATWAIFTWIQISSDRWALERFASPYDLGLYVASFQIGYTPITVVSGLIMSLLGPIVYQKSGNLLDRSKNESMRIIVYNTIILNLSITLMLFIITALYHREIFFLTVSLPFREYSGMMPWFILGAGLFNAGQALTLKIASELQTRKLISIKIVTAILGFCFNIIGAWIFGIQGVIASLVLISIIYFIWIFIISDIFNVNAVFNP